MGDRSACLFWEALQTLTTIFVEVDLDEEFFDFKGDSLEAIPAQHTVNRDFDLNLTNTELLENSIIAVLAQRIGQDRQVEQRVQV